MCTQNEIYKEIQTYTYTNHIYKQTINKYKSYKQTNNIMQYKLT